MTQDRKQQIIDAASQLIAQKGFEGLRTREIAEIVGLNHATVHYHFRDKETLITAVVRSITEKVYQADTQQLATQNMNVRQRLQTYFHNNLLQRQKYPERFLVLGELTMRSNRNPAIKRILTEQDKDWFARMQSVLDEGVRNGDFRPDLNTKNMAVMLVSFLRGIHIQLSQEEIDQYMQLYHQIEQDMLIHH